MLVLDSITLILLVAALGMALLGVIEIFVVLILLALVWQCLLIWGEM